MVKADIERGFVAVTQDDVPCHLAWLIDASQNDKLQKLFNGGILPLAQDEVVFEGAFTPEGYRNRGNQKWRVSEYLKTAAEFGRRWAYAFVRQVNSISLQNDLKMGFVPYLIRQDKWRRFHREITFTEFHISVLSKLGFQKGNPLSVMG